MNATREQQAAIDSDADKILCVACAGSGKTATMVERILRLVRDGVQPENMAAITYTINAAKELADRLCPKDGSVSIHLGFCGTLHSYCLRHLQLNGYEDVIVLDQEEADAELERVARDCNVGESLKKLKQWKVDYHKGGLLTATRAVAAIVIGSYYRRLEAERLLDYDSILHMALASFQRQVPDRDKVWEHLFVDEFQDASELDAEIYQCVLAKNRFYIGDPRQSIFSFRGGSVEPILKLEADPAWLKLPLSGTFRCSEAVAEAANRLMEHSETARLGVHKAVISLVDTRGEATSRAFESDEAEAFGIAEAIKSHAQDGDHWRYAVLARTRQIAGLIADTLEQAGVPVRRKRKVEDGEWTHARAAVRALHLRTPDSVLRWLSCRMGERELEIIKANHDYGDVDIVRLYLGVADEFPDLWSQLAHLGVMPAEVERTGELWASLTEKTLPNLALAMTQARGDEEAVGEGVFVGTVHSAKGKEFGYVVIAGCEEGIIPSVRADLAEEYRVMYVAMTRARIGLWVTWAGMRARWRVVGGQSNLSMMEPSKFIAEAGL